MMKSAGWDNFWKNQKQSFHEVMRIATYYFADKFKSHFHVKPGDRIMDYGCGPGFLIDRLSETKLNITGLDINPDFLNECRAHHPHLQFIAITTDAQTNAQLLQQAIPNQKFDFIILLSIVQYFKDKGEVQKVINLLLPFLEQNGKIIVADVSDENTSSVSDALSLFQHCLVRFKLLAFVRFIVYVLSSEYRTISKNSSLLHLSSKDIASLCGALGLKFEQIPGLTIHRSRTNYALSKR